jgi:hypothetical protein
MSRLIKGDTECQGCVNAQRRQGRPPRPRKAWTLEEDLVLLDDPFAELPERTASAIKHRRQRIGAFRTELRFHADTGKTYLKAEITTLKRLYGLVSPEELEAALPGRSYIALVAFCRRYGIKRNVKKKTRKVHLSEKTRQTLADRIRGAVPREMPRQVRDEVVQDLILAVLEGRVPIKDIRNQVKAAITRTYAMFPDRGAHLSIDAQLYDDGSTTLVDTIESTAFRF